MANSPLGLLFRINADPSQAASALETFRRTATEQMESVRSEFAQVQRGQSVWSSEFLTQSSAVGSALLSLGQTAGFAFDRFSEGLGRNVATALVYSQSMSEALQRALKSTTASIAAEAVVQGLRSTAFGFYLLAIGDFAGAGSAFESAAVWGSIGGVAAGVGAGISTSGASGGRTAAGYSRGWGGGYRAAAGLGTPSTALAPGAAPLAAPGGNLTVTIMGDTEAANWLANTLNQGVARGVQLTATRTQRPPYAAG